MGAGNCSLPGCLAIEMRFFIEDELLFDAAIYELTTGSNVPDSFEMGSRRYIMKVGRDYRSLSKSDKGFLLEAVTMFD